MSIESLQFPQHPKVRSPLKEQLMGPQQVKILTDPIRRSSQIIFTDSSDFVRIKQKRDTYKATFFPQAIITQSGDVEKGFLGLSEANHRIFIVPPSKDLQTPFNPHGSVNQDIAELLRIRENYVLPTTRKDMSHTENLLILSANWKLLFPLFYEQLPDPQNREGYRYGDDPTITDHEVFPHHKAPASNDNLSQFIEVNLNDYVYIDPRKPNLRDHQRKTCGAIDFLGIGPDGTLFVIEFSPHGDGKSSQLAKQVRGLRTLLTERFPDTSLPRIIPLKGIYAADTDPRVISFMPVSVAYFPIDDAIQKAKYLSAYAAD